MAQSFAALSRNKTVNATGSHAGQLPKGERGGIELLLVHHVEHLGKQGEVVEVKRGYAFNYLLPQGLATGDRAKGATASGTAGGGDPVTAATGPARPPICASVLSISLPSAACSAASF